MAVRDFRWVFLGCAHIPISHQPSLKWAIQNVRDHKPDVIVLGGDQMDTDALSSHAKDDRWTIHQEWLAYRDFLLELRDAAPGHQLVQLDGNHEDRINRGEVAKAVRGALHYNNWLPDSGPSIRDLLDGAITRRYINRRHSKKQQGGTYSLGQVTFYHGYETGVSSQRNQCKRFVDEFGLGVSCHTHAAEPVTQVLDPGKVLTNKWYCNSGTLIDWEKAAQYATRYNIDPWAHGMVVGECRASGEGRNYYRERRWDAEVLVRDRVFDNGF